MKKSTYLLLIIGVLILISYQNCGQELGQLGGSSNKLSDGIPFPIDADIDVIGRMSCYVSSNSNLGTGTYFSYKAVSSNLSYSGAKRSAAFDTFVNAKSGSVYDNRRKYLQSSTKLNYLQMQFSLKVPATMNTNENGFSNRFPHISLKDPMFIESLVNFDIPTNLSDSGFLSSQLDFRKMNLAASDELYTVDTYGPHLTLTLDYINYNDPTLSVGPSTFGESNNSNSIYGNKYKVYLGDLSSQATEKYISNIMEVSAVDGTNRSVSWTCERYKIIRAGADSTASCGTTTGVAITSSGTTEMQKLYRLLGPGWKLYSGSGDRCIKHDSIGGCYDEANNPSATIEYNLTNIQSGQCSDTNSTSGKLCANYLSVCSKMGF